MNAAAAGLLVEVLWPYIAGAAALGVLAGLASWSDGAMRRGGRIGISLAATVLSLGLAAAAVAWVPGRAGLWLDAALALALAYLAGCLAGACGRWAVRAMRRTAGPAIPP